MRFVPAKPPTGSGSFRGWRFLVVLFAGLLTLGVLQPFTATAGAGGPALLSVKDKTVVEADSGTTTANVKIFLSKKIHKKVSVGYRTVDGTAKAGSDYVAKSGRVKFAKGSRMAYVHIPIMGDTVEEPDEYFKVVLFDPYRARIADRVGVVKIIDTDVTPPPPPAPPALSVSDTKVHEGDAAYFKVSLDKPAPDVVTFKYATSDGTADAGQDYYARSGVQSIDKGDTWTVVKVYTIDDKVFEPGPDETFYLNVYGVYGATVLDGHGKAFIDDNDPPPPPKLSVSDTKVDEGDAAWFKVSLSHPVWYPVTFNYATAPGTATPNVDYDTTAASAVIPKGADHVMIKVMTREDSIYEPGADETFYLDVSAVQGAFVLDGRGTAFIKDDELPPSPNLSVLNAASVSEGGIAVFTIQLSAPAPQPVDFDFTTVNGSATAPQDFDAKALNNVVIPKFATSYTVQVQTRHDSDKEGTETFSLKVSDVHGANLVKDTGTGTILDVYPYP